MKNTINFKINNPCKFKCGLRSFVEMSTDFTDCSFDPSNLQTEYFGSFEDNDFTVYHQNVDIEITGQLVEDELAINVNFISRWNYLFDFVIFTIVGISIMIDINTYLGLAVILFVLGQKLIVIRKEEKIKKDFMHKLQELLDKNNNATK